MCCRGAEPSNSVWLLERLCCGFLAATFLNADAWIEEKNKLKQPATVKKTNVKLSKAIIFILFSEKNEVIWVKNYFFL